jgi:3-methyladenine DNA glycosylase/8-oxoguanine DNA glycosylase
MGREYSFQVRDFDPVHIFECGQCFRWERREDGSFAGIAGSRPAEVYFEPSAEGRCEGTLRVADRSGAADDGGAFWYDYFDLGRDYGAIKKTLADRDETIREAIRFGKGIRLLRQDRWEALVSFIISQNNNIPRIKKNIDGLSELGGEKAGTIGEKTYYCLPEPEKLASFTVDDLAPVRLGYRARYLIETGAAISEHGIGYLDEHLGDLCGVGPKVANCISLFSMEKYDSFPIDTWVKQVMEKLYGITGKKEIAAFAEKTFGEYGGFAQQYLFYYIRETSACGDKHLVH